MSCDARACYVLFSLRISFRQMYLWGSSVCSNVLVYADTASYVLYSSMHQRSSQIIKFSGCKKNFKRGGGILRFLYKLPRVGVVYYTWTSYQGIGISAVNKWWRPHVAGRLCLSPLSMHVARYNHHVVVYLPFRMDRALSNVKMVKITSKFIWSFWGTYKSFCFDVNLHSYP
jgi:hypothetical protein